MNISYLKAFTETVQASSISKAAEVLHLTQPAVSLQIQNLENSLGYKLFFRSNRGVHLTDYGKVFYSYAQSFLTLWENLQHDLESTKDSEHPTLSIGTCPVIGQYALPCALYLFKQKYPQIRVSVQSMASGDVLNGIRKHTLQIGFVEGKPDHSDLFSLNILETDLILVGIPQTNIAQINLSDLHSLPLILSPEGCDLRQALQACLHLQGVDIKSITPFLELDGVESLKSTVRSGHGYSFLPYFTIKKELFSGELKQIKVEGGKMRISFSMIWRKEDNLTIAGNEFIKFIKSEGTRGFC